MSDLTTGRLAQIVEQGNTEALFGSREKEETTFGQDFSEVLKNSMDQVNTYQHQADSAIKELLAGRSKNIHETLLTIERADSSLKLMMSVRNKILDAYREVMRMQV